MDFLSIDRLQPREGQPHRTDAIFSVRQEPQDVDAESFGTETTAVESLPSPALSGRTLTSNYDSPLIVACSGCDACDIPIESRPHDRDNPRTWPAQPREQIRCLRGSLNDIPVFKRHEDGSRATLRGMYDGGLDHKDEKYNSALTRLAFVAWPFNFNSDGMPKHEATMTVCEERLWLQLRIKELTRNLLDAVTVARDEIRSNRQLRSVITKHMSIPPCAPTNAWQCRFSHNVIEEADMLESAGQPDRLRYMERLLKFLRTSEPCLQDLLDYRGGDKV
ncbi:hypothetical protein BKA63DRAFT_567344 [Paraphoma chrysanthemicola]|nr:hypothetical protein BKA63DRAFT_567344 [Paraphoma chrysanthemicola]